MTEPEFNLTKKNVRQWTKFIEKVQRKAKAAKRKLTDDEVENLDMRKAQIIVWGYQLKACEKQGFSGLPVEGEMSVDSEMVTGEQAVATE